MKKNPIGPRAVFSMLAVVVLVAVFVIRLVDIQVVSAAAYNQDALNKRSIPSTIFATRGDIVDRSGTVLADSVMRYNITISPKNTKDFYRRVDGKEQLITTQQAATEIGSFTGQKPEEILKIVADALAADPKSDFAYVKKAVEVDAFRSIKALNIPWIFYESAPGRSYPNGSVAANLLGYVGQDGKAQGGVELSEDECVAGVNGEEVYQRGADGVRIPGSTVTSVDAKNGGLLKLTIDSDLQWYTQQTLAARVDQFGAKWGIAVVQEVKTGKLLAVADYPSFDSNNVSASPAANRGARSFQAPYEPGSTMKPITAASLIEAGVATPQSQVVAPNSIMFPNGAHVADASAHGVLRLTLAGVIEQSSNVGITQLGEALPAEKRYAFMEKFGIGEDTGINFPGQSSGIVHPWQEWDYQTYYNTMFGQAFAATAIQMSSAYQAIGNKGVKLAPRLVESCTKPDGSVVTPKLADPVKVISESTARSTVDMMENFVTQGWINSSVSIPGYRIAMKTGTAEHSDGAGGLSSQYIVSNMGVFPAEDPQYAVTVVIADPQISSTSVVCPPVFKDIISHVIKRYRLQPTSTQATVLPIRF